MRNEEEIRADLDVALSQQQDDDAAPHDWDYSAGEGTRRLAGNP